MTSIEEKTFSFCRSLTSITIPDGVTSIGNEAFYDCRSLTSITIPNSVTNIRNWAFCHCSNLTSITIPDSVTSIGDRAFVNCANLKSIIIPNRLTNIGKMVFARCTNLTSITISSSVTCISSDAFSQCDNISSIIVDKDNKIYDSRNNCNALIDTKTNCLLMGCQNTKIPNSIKSIGTGAFYFVGNLDTLIIPENIEEIKEQAFLSCSIKKIIIQEGVKKIGKGAFAYSNIEYISFPSTLEEMADDVFEETDEFKTVNVPKSVYKKFSIFEDWFGADSDELVIR